ncbi:hypothetical protein F4677DRAFT_408645 [Hypoxylon crocopeplum]|nr:hypothetical protein F4677DRAFT_408645 [Hypoxylon crocopeplum]
MSSLRKSSCRSCAEAKRRCDKSLPACSRCRLRSLECRYPYPAKIFATYAERHEQLLGVHSQQESTSAHRNDSPMALSSLSAGLDPTFALPQRSSDGSGSDEFNLSVLCEGLTPLQKRALDFWPRADDVQTWNYCVQTFLSYIDTFVRYGCNSFIHRSQEPGLQPPLRMAFGVCAAYKARTDANQAIFQQLLDVEVERLDADSPSSSSAEKLATLQAMVLYHILMLFSGDIYHQFLGEQRETQLAQCTAALENSDVLAVRDTAESWALHESARRTIMLSHLLRCVYQTLKYKSCHLIGTLVSLPVSLRSQLEWQRNEPQTLPANPNLGQVVTYHEFVKEWEDGRLSKVDDFGQLLLAACKGLLPVREKLNTSLNKVSSS